VLYYMSAYMFVSSCVFSYQPHVQDPSDLLIKYLQQDLPMLIQYAPAMPLITISIKCLCTMVRTSVFLRACMQAIFINCGCDERRYV
jgi:hypothetical protein